MELPSSLLDIVLFAFFGVRDEHPPLFLVKKLGELGGVPVVPHKAVAEVSKTGTYRRGWLL